ncbi:MAG: alpha/beta hydrolase [Bacteroidota bacterium]
MIRTAFKALALAVGLAVLVLGVVIAIPVEPTIPAITPRAGTQYWTMPGDYRIAYTHLPADPTSETATSPKPPVVYLHGGPGGYIHSSAIDALRPLTALGHDVYLYDQIGSGLSDRLARPKDYTFLGHTEDLRVIVAEHLGGGPVVLIGQSYGGMLASYMAAHHPDLVARAILTSPGGIEPALFDEDGQWATGAAYPVPDSLTFREPADISHDAGLSSWPVRSIATVALATAFNVSLMPDDEADGVLNTVVSKITRGMVCDPAHVLPEEGGGGFYSHGWSNWYGDMDDWRPELAASPVPLLVLQGSCDYIPFASAYEHAALAPQGTYRFIEDAGHALFWDQPNAYLAEIRRFLEE